MKTTRTSKSQNSSEDIKRMLTSAEELLENEKYQEAERVFRQIIEYLPSYSAAWFGLGEALFNGGFYEDAGEAYSQVLQLDEEHSDALFGLAAALRVEEHYEEAIKVYYKAFNADSERNVAYWELAYCLEMVDDIKAAEYYYDTCLLNNPDHGMAKHLRAAMLGSPSDHAPIDYIQELFDDYADTFDEDLLEDLNYVVPELIYEELANLWKRGLFSRGHRYPLSLDLGCGTGLVAASLTSLTDLIHGVDLSKNMTKIAESKGYYDELFISEFVAFLLHGDQGKSHYDLILCGDSLVYIGDLSDFFTGITKRLNTGGIVCFTTEHTAADKYTLLRSGRFAHNSNYINSLAEANGLTPITSKTIIPRKESSAEISGRLYVMRL
ncbi:MAG: tetratricopeptide repeat protein [Pseudomonadota bacterium]|nr:tetratricopeptide repeat protein [Pseudomonadota bacterium]